MLPAGLETRTPAKALHFECSVSTNSTTGADGKHNACHDQLRVTDERLAHLVGWYWSTNHTSGHSGHDNDPIAILSQIQLT